MFTLNKNKSMNKNDNKNKNRDAPIIISHYSVTGDRVKISRNADQKVQSDTTKLESTIYNLVLFFSFNHFLLMPCVRPRCWSDAL